MERQEISTQSGVRNAESTISHKLTPFTEVAKWISGDVIQGMSMENCSPPCPLSNCATSISEYRKASKDMVNASARLFWGRRLGTQWAARKPVNGTTRTES